MDFGYRALRDLVADDNNRASDNRPSIICATNRPLSDRGRGILVQIGHFRRIRTAPDAISLPMTTTAAVSARAAFFDDFFRRDSRSRVSSIRSLHIVGKSLKLPVLLKLTNTDPFAEWLTVTADATLDGIRVVRSVLGAIISLPFVAFPE